MSPEVMVSSGAMDAGYSYPADVISLYFFLVFLSIIKFFL